MEPGTVITAQAMANHLVDMVKDENKNMVNALSKIVSWPVAKIFQFIFSPILIFWATLRTVKDIKKGSDPHLKMRLGVLIFGQIVGALIAYLITSVVGTAAICYVLFNVLGTFSALGYALGVGFGWTIIVLMQFLLYNIICALFLSLAKKNIVEYNYDKYIKYE